MKRWQEILLGLLLFGAAVGLVMFVDSGYRPDSMNCGSGMNGVGYCYDDSGCILLALLKGALVIIFGLVGFCLIVGPQPAATEEQGSSTAEEADNDG